MIKIAICNHDAILVVNDHLVTALSMVLFSIAVTDYC